MLRRWLGNAYHDFVRARHNGLPFSFAGIHAAQASLFDWSKLDEVLRSEPPPEVLVVRRGQLLDAPAPRGQQAVKELFAAGVGVVVRHAQRHAASLRRLTADVEAELSASAHLQLFVTPAQTHGFGWHYDPDDVTIVQTVGEKDFYFRVNTQQPTLEGDVKPDFSLIRSEISPLLSCHLAAGDVLYLPRGTWHVAYATHDALSLSMGVR